MMPLDPDVASASNDAIETQRAALAGFESGIQTVSAKWRADIVDLIGGGDNAKLANIVYLQKQLQSGLNRAGYDELLRQHIANYDGAREQAVAQVEALDLKPERLSSPDTQALQNLKRMDYSYMSAAGTAAVTEIARGVTQNVIAGQRRSDMIAAADKVIEGRFKPHVVTYADTALVSYDRRATWGTMSGAGVTHLMYRGPADIKNRDWCAARVGKVFTVAQIEEMKNPTGPNPPKFFGGGWRCRHVFAPVVEGVPKPPPVVAPPPGPPPPNKEEAPPPPVVEEARPELPLPPVPEPALPVDPLEQARAEARGMTVDELQQELITRRRKLNSASDNAAASAFGHARQELEGAANPLTSEERIQIYHAEGAAISQHYFAVWDPASIPELERKLALEAANWQLRRVQAANELAFEFHSPKYTQKMEADYRALTKSQQKVERDRDFTRAYVAAGGKLEPQRQGRSFLVPGAPKPFGNQKLADDFIAAARSRLFNEAVAGERIVVGTHIEKEAVDRPPEMSLDQFEKMRTAAFQVIAQQPGLLAYLRKRPLGNLNWKPTLGEPGWLGSYNWKPRTVEMKTGFHPNAPGGFVPGQSWTVDDAEPDPFVKVGKILRHEVGHHIHGEVFGSAEDTQLTVLYDKAKKAERAITRYALFTRYEYFTENLQAYWNYPLRLKAFDREAYDLMDRIVTKYIPRPLPLEESRA